MKSLMFLLSRSFSPAFTSTFSGSLAKGLKVDLMDLKPEAKEAEDDPGSAPEAEDNCSCFKASLRSVLRNRDLNAAGWYEAEKSSEALSPMTIFTTFIDASTRMKVDENTEKAEHCQYSKSESRIESCYRCNTRSGCRCFYYSRLKCFTCSEHFSNPAFLMELKF